MYSDKWPAGGSIRRRETESAHYWSLMMSVLLTSWTYTDDPYISERFNQYYINIIGIN